MIFFRGKGPGKKRKKVTTSHYSILFNLKSSLLFTAGHILIIFVISFFLLIA